MGRIRQSPSRTPQNRLQRQSEARRGECGQEKRPPPSARRAFAPQLTPGAVCSGRSAARCLVVDPAGQRCSVPGGAARLLPPGCAAAPLRARAMLFVCGSAKCSASAPGARPPRAEWSALPLSASPPSCGPTSPAASFCANAPGRLPPALARGGRQASPAGLVQAHGGLYAPARGCGSVGVSASLRVRWAASLSPPLRSLPPAFAAPRAPPLRRSPGAVGEPCWNSPTMQTLKQGLQRDLQQCNQLHCCFENLRLVTDRGTYRYIPLRSRVNCALRALDVNGIPR